MSMPKRILILAGVLHAASVAVIAGFNLLGPERWWITGANMFLPQWLWAIPALILFPFTIWKARRWSWVPAFTFLLVAGPIMGLCWNTERAPVGVPLRVMTYNVQSWHRARWSAIVEEIRRARPDILCLQDAREVVQGPVGEFLKSWEIAASGQYVLASRFPILDSTAGDISYEGETHTYFRARIQILDQRVTVFNAHLATPRDALNVLRSPSFSSMSIPVVKANLSQRITQARTVATDAREVKGPLIVAGDLNAPPQSLASRILTDVGLVDAFSAGGRGYGYTFGHTLFIGKSFVRIDRILVSRHFTPMRAMAGGATASDHRPVIADLTLSR